MSAVAGTSLTSAAAHVEADSTKPTPKTGFWDALKRNLTNPTRFYQFYNAGVAVLVGGSFVKYEYLEWKSYLGPFGWGNPIPAEDYPSEYVFDAMTHVYHCYVTEKSLPDQKLIMVALNVLRMMQIHKNCFTTDCQRPSTSVPERLNHIDFDINHVINLIFLSKWLIDDAVKARVTNQVFKEQSDKKLFDKVQAKVDEAFEARVQAGVAAALAAAEKAKTAAA